jgi:hypothetical protein
MMVLYWAYIDRLSSIPASKMHHTTGWVLLPKRRFRLGYHVGLGMYCLDSLSDLTVNRMQGIPIAA